MRICIDIDGTLCHLRKETEAYSNVVPIEGAVDTLKALNEKGYYIILCTARHMKTCEGNLGKVIARQGLTLMQWLEKHDVVYDELWFGKPHADLYIDDKGVRFTGCWKHMHNLIEALIKG